MIIGILQTGFVPEPLVAKYGEYPSMFERMLAGHGFEFQTFVVVENQFPPSVHACDGWLITGSAAGAYEAHPFIPPLEKFIRAAYAAEVPLAGICFGHQIMAQALGGKVVKHDQGWGVGQSVYKNTDQQQMLLAMHQDQVVSKPPAAEVIVCSDFCANAGLAYRGEQGIKALSFQPHPEFTPEYMRDLIALRAGKGMSAEQAQQAMAEVAEENDSLRIAQQLAEFFLAAKGRRVGE